MRTLFILFFPLILHSQEITAGEIIERVNSIINPEKSKAQLEMTIVTTSGKIRTFLYESYSKNYGEKNLIKYIEPKRVKGQKILLTNNAEDIWMYFPRTGRVRRLATHAKKQKMEGSDFSYEDMGSGNTFVKDFKSKLISEEKLNNIDCYKLELTRKEEKSSSYSRIVMWVAKENFVPLYLEYYDEEDPTLKIKTLTLSDIRIIEGIPTPMELLMKDVVDNTETKLKIIDIHYDVDIPDEIFTERGLKR